MSADPADTSALPGGEPPVDPLFDALAETCRTLDGFGGPGDPSWVDGYLVAIAASRRCIGTAEWLPRLGGEAFERAFADPQAVARATSSLEAWLARRREELDPLRLTDRPDEVFVTPLFDEWTDEDRQRILDAGETPEAVASLHSGCLWAAGFLAAVEDFADDWPGPGESDLSVDAQAYRALLQLIGCLTLDPADEGCRSFLAEQWRGTAPSRDELLDEVCFAVQDLRVHWLDHPPKPVQRRVAATPGRTDPCPCGSGLKFKKCHGAAA